MKKFRSIGRAIRRGHLVPEMNTAIQQVVLMRKISKHQKVFYAAFNPMAT